LIGRENVLAGIKLLFILLLLFLFNLPGLFSEELYIQGPGYYIDLPEGWKPVESYNKDSDNRNLSYSDSRNTAFLNITVFPPDTFKKAEDIFNFVKKQLNASGDGAPFLFSGKDSYFADLKFKSGGRNRRGYFIFINGSKGGFDYALLTFSRLENYDNNHDAVLSALDSFSPDKNARLLPGPVSQFYYPADYISNVTAGGKQKPDRLKIGKTNRLVPVQLGGNRYVLPFDQKEIEATGVLVEREARLLSGYKPESEYAVKAWKRFYRMIYRDNYHRLDKLYSILFKGEKNRNKAITDMLNFVQRFKYMRTGTISDLLSPLSAVSQFTGDCDSRGLLFLILLHHIDVDSILLISSKYNHSAVGIGIRGKGAKINFNGRNYLYTEVTDRVAMGRVPKSMADPAGWIPVKLGE